MEEESKPYCHKFNRSQSNRLPVDSLKNSSGNLAVTPAVARGRLTRMSNLAIARLCIFLVSYWLVSSCGRTSRPMTKHCVASCVIPSRHAWSCSRRVLTSNPKSELCISAYHFYLFKSWILLTNHGGLLMQIISIMLWVTLILTTIYESLAKYMSSTFKCRQFRVFTSC